MTDATASDAGRSPLDTVPNANSPHLLTHLLEMVARGVRSSRGLEEALGVDPRTLRYYLHAARWLGLLSDRADPVLSPEGLAYVYAGAARPDVYARVVRDHPFLSTILDRCGGHAPDAGTIAEAIREADPALAQSTVERRASSVRGLLLPALQPAEVPEDDGQLTLPLAQVPRVTGPQGAATGPGRAFSPDLYRWVLFTLLDHGELTLGHLRALLDHADAHDIPLGAYVDLATARGDAVRRDERLIVTPGAIRRRDLAATTTSVILSDGGWRTAYDALRDGRDDPAARPYRLWYRRLVGHDTTPDAVERAVARVLEDRSLDAFPRAIPDPGPPPLAVERPFLDAWEASGLIIALPSSLVQVWEGVRGINRRLRNARTRADAVGMPTAAYRPAVVHGGLLHPGETIPRAITDAHALRWRAASRSPYVALLTALLLLPRLTDRPPTLRRVHGRWEVTRGRIRHGAVLDVLDAFAARRGWHTSRFPQAGLDADVLVSLTVRLGLAVPTDDAVWLDDHAFHALRHDDDARALATPLEALAASLDGWLSGLERAARRR